MSTFPADRQDRIGSVHKIRGSTDTIKDGGRMIGAVLFQMVDHHNSRAAFSDPAKLSGDLRHVGVFLFLRPVEAAQGVKDDQTRAQDAKEGMHRFNALQIVESKPLTREHEKVLLEGRKGNSAPAREAVETNPGIGFALILIDVNDAGLVAGMADPVGTGSDCNREVKKQKALCGPALARNNGDSLPADPRRDDPTKIKIRWRREIKRLWKVGRNGDQASSSEVWIAVTDEQAAA